MFEEEEKLGDTTIETNCIPGYARDTSHDNQSGTYQHIRQVTWKPHFLSFALHELGRGYTFLSTFANYTIPHLSEHAFDPHTAFA